MKTNSLVVPEPDVLERLKGQKLEIDSLFIYYNSICIGNVLHFTQATENSLPFRTDSIRMSLDDFYDYYTQFIILQKNSNSNKIIFIAELPYCRSGDFYLAYIHYFDQNEQTFAYEKRFNTFHCTNGIGYETATKYYNFDFQQIGEEYKLVDENGNPMLQDSCMLDDYGDKVYPNVEKYLAGHKINLKKGKQ
ncbi:MAG: hypothetical protein FWF72_04785 [Paludibacter sp.]|nr:hypothetical protein [Paludibacter sp.]